MECKLWYAPTKLEVHLAAGGRMTQNTSVNCARDRVKLPWYGPYLIFVTKGTCWDLCELSDLALGSILSFLNSESISKNFRGSRTFHRLNIAYLRSYVKNMPNLFQKFVFYAFLCNATLTAWYNLSKYRSCDSKRMYKWGDRKVSKVI